MSEQIAPAGMPGMTRRNRHPLGGPGFSPKQMAFLRGPLRDQIKAEILAELQGLPGPAPVPAPAAFVLPEGPTPLPVPLAGPEMVPVPARPALVTGPGGAIEDDETPPPVVTVLPVVEPVVDTYASVPNATPAMLGLINECVDPVKKQELRAIASADEPAEVRLRKMRKALSNK